MRTLLFVTALLLLITIEILKVYFIIPFPHSQAGHKLGVSYFINMNIWWLRVAALLIIIYPLWQLLRKSKLWQKGLLVTCVLLYATVAYLCNFKYAADRIFDEPREKIFTTAADALKHSGQLVIGVTYNGEDKAYPVSVVAFHHQVKDTVGGKSVIVTYCSFCHTGRVYSPFINGKYDLFRLVGMNNSNAIFEDEATKSWWQQASGIAITGDLKGAQLNEVPSEIMYMGQWLLKHPKSVVMMPDKNFLQQYYEFNIGIFKIY